MARNAMPLLAASPLPELRGGVELLIVETLLAHPDPTGRGGHEEEHGLCVLLLVDPTEVERRWIRAEAQRYVGARATVVAVPDRDWAAGVERLLGGFDEAFVDLVFGLPMYKAEVEKRSVALVQALKSGHHKLCTVVAVTAEPAAWSDIGECVGLVAPLGMGANAGAIVLHAGLAQVSAPQLIECVRTEEVNAVFDARGGAATLLLTDALGLANSLKSSDAAEHGSHPSATAVLFLDDLDLKGYSDAARAMLAAGVEGPLIVAPSGLTTPSPTSSSPRCAVVIKRGDH